MSTYQAKIPRKKITNERLLNQKTPEQAKEAF